MKSLNVYSEHIINSPLGSIKENISNTPDKNKRAILRHLKNANVIATFAGIAKDIFTGENIPGEWLLLSDGVYEWSSDIIYYYERYNLKLLPEFVFYIENPEIYAVDYICDDREKEMCDKVKNMSKEEIEEEFQRRFGKYIKIEKDDNFEEIERQYQTKTPSEWEDEFEKEKERIEELKKLGELDDLAATAGGYVVPSYKCDFDASAEIAKFIEYCELLGKTPNQLTKEELENYHRKTS